MKITIAVDFDGHDIQISRSDDTWYPDGDHARALLSDLLDATTNDVRRAAGIPETAATAPASSAAPDTGGQG